MVQCIPYVTSCMCWMSLKKLSSFNSKTYPHNESGNFKIKVTNIFYKSIINSTINMFVVCFEKTTDQNLTLVELFSMIFQYLNLVSSIKKAS